MSYHYSRFRSDEHRDVAHWRGARGGVRVLNVPTCDGWLQRQANDACYDFWPDLAIGAQLVREHDGPPLAAVQPAVTAAALFVMQQDPDGAWFIDPWRTDRAGQMRPLAANGEQHGVDAVGRATREWASIESPCDSVRGTSFIIEIGARRS
jgi:hypothetical protein